MNENIIGDKTSVGSVLSFSKDGLVTTSYADDNVVKGNGFQVNRRITLTNAQTLYLVLDTTALVAAGKLLFILPLQMKTAGGLVFVDTYKIESYTGGTIIPFAKANDMSINTALSVLKSGITPTGTPGNDLREYIVGTKSTNQSSGGGTNVPDIAKQFSAGTLITAKIVNQETDPVTIEFGLVIFEI